MPIKHYLGVISGLPVKALQRQWLIEVCNLGKQVYYIAMYRFGVFEADFGAGELRKCGLRIKIQEQPLRILEALLEQPSELVSREQLRDRLWPSDTFVDFERSLNAAVARLRLALGDSAERPIFVETVAKKGYRFIGPVSPMPKPVVEDEVLVPAPKEEAPRSASKTRILLAALVGALVLGGAAIFSWRSGRLSQAGNGASVSFTVPMPGNRRIGGNYFSPSVAVSRDGSTIAFVATVPDDTALYVRSLSSETSQRLDGTEDAEHPFWSPDGSAIGFVSRGKLKTVTLHGGHGRILCDVNQSYAATWSRDGTILFSSDMVLYRIAAEGGERTQVTTLDRSRGDFRHSSPQFLPDGRRFLFFIVAEDQPKSGVYLGSLDTASPRLVFLNRTFARFAPPDLLVYVKDSLLDSTLVAQPWDIRSLRSLGEPHVITKGVNTFSIAAAAFSLSDNGVLAYRKSSAGDSQLAMYRRDGKRIRTIGPPGPYSQAAVSPDEKLVALDVNLRGERSLVSKIWLLQMDNEVVSKFDFGTVSYVNPVWSPDSKQLAFDSFAVGGMRTQLWLWKIGDPSPTFFFADGNNNWPEDWSPDKRFLLCLRGGARLFTLPLKKDAKPADMGGAQSPKGHMRFSPDGRYVAYIADSSGRPEVFIAEFPGFTGIKQVSSHGGIQPVWNRTGKELFYVGPGATVMSVSIDTGTSLKSAAPKELFKIRPLVAGGARRYAPSADGQSFYVLESVPGPVPDELHVKTNWTAGLGR